jgi:predicted ABC-class ATPase
MDRYRARDASEQARALVIDAPEPLLTAAQGQPGALSTDLTAARRLGEKRLRWGPRATPRIQAFGCEQLRLGDWRIDLGRVEQLVEPGQLRAIGWLIAQLADAKNNAPNTTLLDALRHALRQIETQGLDRLSPFYPEPHGGLALPRLQELFAALNRLRELPIKTE